MIPDYELIQRKLQRIRSGAAIRTVDLFAGAGGFSLGFHRHGFEVVAAVEINDDARKTHETNFRPRCEHYKAFADITDLRPSEAVAHVLEAGVCRTPEEAVDVIIGGPPCQPFSLQGRAKLAHIAGEPRAFEDDPRVTLYTRYLAFVAELKPVAFVMENVLGVGNFKGQNIPESIAAEASELGYEVRYALLNAAWYGVPQMRERMIVIGVHKAVGRGPEFPAPLHVFKLPQGYVTSRWGSGKAPLRAPHDNYREVPHPKGKKRAVTAEKALLDLPPITYHLQPDAKVRGERKFGTLQRYRPRASNDFIKAMRNWPGFTRSDGGVVDHVIRHTPRDYRIFSAMEPGDQYPEAHAIAERLYQEAVDQAGPTGEQVKREKYVPPYPVNKYPNKWRKMEADMPARTLPAHLSHDAYSHIHYDSTQARTISVREAARLQSFPDGFEFPVSMVAAFRQIGNAVPPLMAAAIAECLKEVLRDAA